VRHFSQIGNNRRTDEINAQRNGQAQGRFGKCIVVLQENRFSFEIGDFNADDGLAGDRRQNPDAGRHQRQGQIIGQIGNAVDLDAGGRFQLVHGNHGTGHHFHNARFDAEIRQLLFQDARVGNQMIAFNARVLLGCFFQQGKRRQLEFAVGFEFGKIEMRLLDLI